MDGTHFDDMARSLAAVTRNRRSAVALLGTALAALTAGATGLTRPAAAACRQVGAACKRAGQCCSGVCKGAKGAKTCRAHDVGTCRPELDFCLTDAECNGRTCICLTTTGGALFCGLPGGPCAVCERDRDCLRLGFPSGSACVRLSGERCAGSCTETGGTACFAPCGLETPAHESRDRIERFTPV